MHPIALASSTRPRLGLLQLALVGALASLAACGGGTDSTAEADAPTTATTANAPADDSRATAEDYGSGRDAAAAESDTAQLTVAADTTGSTATSADTGGTMSALAVDPAYVSVPGTITLPNPTLQNLTVEWAFTGDANKSAVVNVRYRKTGTTAWTVGAPLRRIQAASTSGFSWATRHSGSVFDLQPGTSYDLELALVDADGGSTTRTVTVATRAVPQPMAGAPIKAATTANYKTVLAAAVPGDIIELAAGSYAAFSLTKDGTEAKPIVVRPKTGLAKGSVIVNGELSLISRKYVQIRGLTVNGRIRFNSSLGVAIVGNTVNAQRSVGDGDGIVTWNASENAYIADNTVNGTTVWANSSLGVNGDNWGEGILVSGPGHVIMNNRVKGFRDGISFLEGTEAVKQYSIDVLNNDISETADDAIEADFCHHNCRIMRNRLTNTFIAMSSQPGLGGPTWFIRNVAYNVAHVGFKLYRTSYGDVLLHNTIVKNGDAFGAYPGVPIYNLLSRNNLFIGGPGGTWGGYSSGSGRVIDQYYLDTASSSIDYDALGSTLGTFNAQVGSLRTSTLADLRAKTTEKNAVQVGLTAFAATVAFPAAAMTQFTAPDLRLRAGGGATDVGQVLPGINDGFTGTKPDAGAYEYGTALPVYGPRI
ncbi:right-handed parallel beta-helix repeat-containing protein [Sphaerotilus microaerophilus]|nr:right-handed parallel beta-helix repeat-containing protein [Sphaerotilus sp. FB-5]